jgi:serine/threonine protein kinase
MAVHSSLAVQDWHRLNRLLERALEVEAGGRAAWFATLPAESNDLRPLLEDLLARSALASLDGTSETLQPVVRMAAEALAGMRREQPGDRIGPWRLQRMLAEGGMGTVWLAERSDGVMQRRAALKLPRAEWVDRGLSERIARERSILALLQHANIAVLYDAGVTESGRPYLALEYVEGQPIDEFCSEHALDLNDLLRLFVQVVRAVASAHNKLVIHRDLKPNNVLVTADGQPKLLDFGIAKLLETDTPTTDETALTRLVGRPLTLRYAAPEQILGQPISVAADIYALGVMLYELLSGTRPYQAASDNKRALEQEILSGVVVRPSSVATEKSRARALHGDLDAIVLKTLKKNPEERYETAAALADDIERHLSGQPVIAQPDSRPYRLRKFIARNRIPVAAGSAIVIALGIGLGAALWQANVAHDQAQRATALNTFVLSLIQQADPHASQQTKAADLAMLGAIEERIDKEFKGSPDQLLQLRITVGDAFRNRGEMMAARRVLVRAVTEATPSLQADDLRVLTARVRSADNNLIVSNETSQDLDRAIEILRSKGPAGSELLIDALLNRHELEYWYGVPEFASPERRLQILHEAFALATRHFGNGSRQQLKLVGPLGGLKALLEGRAEAQRFYESSLAYAVARSDGAHSSFEYLQAHSAYAEHLCRIGRSAEVMPMLWDSLAAIRAAHGPHSVQLEIVLETLADCSWAIGDSTGYRLIEDAFEVAAARERPPSTNLFRRAQRAVSLMDRISDPDAGERYYQHALDNSHAIPEPELRDKFMKELMNLRVCLLAQRGAADEAEAVAAPLVAYHEAEFRRTGRLNPGEGDLWLCLSYAQRQNGRFTEAVQTAQTMVDRCRATNLKYPSLDGRSGLFNHLRCQGRALALRALAELALGRAADAMATVEERLKMSREFSRDRRFAGAYGRVLLANGRAQEAIEPLRINYGYGLSLAPNSVFTTEAEYWLGQAYLATGDKRGRWMVDEARQKLATSPIKTQQALAAGTTSATESQAVSK